MINQNEFFEANEVVKKILVKSLESRLKINVSNSKLETFYLECDKFFTNNEFYTSKKEYESHPFGSVTFSLEDICYKYYILSGYGLLENVDSYNYNLTNIKQIKESDFEDIDDYYFYCWQLENKNKSSKQKYFYKKEYISNVIWGDFIYKELIKNKNKVVKNKVNKFLKNNNKEIFFAIANFFDDNDKEYISIIYEIKRIFLEYKIIKKGFLRRINQLIEVFYYATYNYNNEVNTGSICEQKKYKSIKEISKKHGLNEFCIRDLLKNKGYIINNLPSIQIIKKYICYVSFYEYRRSYNSEEYFSKIDLLFLWKENEIQKIIKKNHLFILQWEHNDSIRKNQYKNPKSKIDGIRKINRIMSLIFNLHCNKFIMDDDEEIDIYYDQDDDFNSIHNPYYEFFEDQHSGLITSEEQGESYFLSHIQNIDYCIEYSDSRVLKNDELLYEEYKTMLFKYIVFYKQKYINN